MSEVFEKLAARSVRLSAPGATAEEAKRQAALPRTWSGPGQPLAMPLAVRAASACGFTSSARLCGKDLTLRSASARGNFLLLRPSASAPFRSFPLAWRELGS